MIFCEIVSSINSAFSVLYAELDIFIGQEITSMVSGEAFQDVPLKTRADILLHEPYQSMAVLSSVQRPSIFFGILLPVNSTFR